jgi:hypothetical protein
MAVQINARMLLPLHYGYLSATTLIEQWAAQVASEVAEKEEQKARKAIAARYKHNAMSIELVSNRVGETRVRDNLDENGGDICSVKRRPRASR